MLYSLPTIEGYQVANSPPIGRKGSGPAYPLLNRAAMLVYLRFAPYNNLQDAVHS